MTRDIEKLAIVTGAAGGMGLAIARRLAAQGAVVCMVDVQAELLEQAAETIRKEGREVIACPLDLADEAALSALPERIGKRFESVAVLVNNAAISPKSADGVRVPAERIPLEEWERVFRINLTAPFRLTQLCLPPMRRRGWGRIVNIASRAGRSPGGVAGAHYVTSKSALLGMTRAFAKEVADGGITVNSVAPGRIETPMSRRVAPDLLEKALAGIPVGRFGTTDEIGALVGFLAGEEAGFITGAVIDINGGVLMI